MSLSKSAIAEAIKVELDRDQVELQEIQKRLLELEERARANRAWLKAYGFLETGMSTPAAPPIVQAETSLHLVSEAAATVAEESNPAETNPQTTDAVASDDAKPLNITAEPPLSVLKNEGRKELYEALISRGARIGS